MRRIRVRRQRRALTFICILATALLLLTSISSAALAADKMKAEDVIAKHLEAIGSAKERSSDRSRVIVGAAHAVFNARNNSGAIDGRAVFGSINRKVLLGMAFPAPNYVGEKFGFDGKKFTVGYLKPGVRSTLGGFLLIHSNIFKEGLVGGTLSSAWPLLNLAEREAKIDYAGTDKIAGQLVHKLRYSPSKGSELDITLFFDAKTFYHVRTQYDRVAAAKFSAGGVDNQASQRAMRYRLTEDFSDYGKEGDLNLPHSYKLKLEIENTNGTSAHTWTLKLEQFAFNQEIDDKGFDVEGN